MNLNYNPCKIKFSSSGSSSLCLFCLFCFCLFFGRLFFFVGVFQQFCLFMFTVVRDFWLYP